VALPGWSEGGGRGRSPTHAPERLAREAARKRPGEATRGPGAAHFTGSPSGADGRAGPLAVAFQSKGRAGEALARGPWATLSSPLGPRGRRAKRKKAVGGWVAPLGIPWRGGRLGRGFPRGKPRRGDERHVPLPLERPARGGRGQARPSAGETQATKKRSEEERRGAHPWGAHGTRRLLAHRARPRASKRPRSSGRPQKSARAGAASCSSKHCLAHLELARRAARGRS
jgi:hypothetical protein